MEGGGENNSLKYESNNDYKNQPQLNSENDSELSSKNKIIKYRKKFNDLYGKEPTNLTDFFHTEKEMYDIIQYLQLFNVDEVYETEQNAILQKYNEYLSMFSKKFFNEVISGPFNLKKKLKIY